MKYLKLLRFASLAGVSMMFIAMPAHAEYHWNPFDHMTEDDVSSLIVMLTFYFLMRYLIMPLCVGFLTYKVLQSKYPSESVKIKQVLLWAFGTQFLLGFVLNSVFSLLPDLIGFFLGISLPAAGAATNYFAQIRQAEE
ncbi:hypothetical protein HER32_01045 [Hymenobacter sp. BT18]|uniref:hypothetical protein n=1 Tax=Hymenobacter sp. BT18 TaxID=2835648 RepID=UPI00143E2597|nr:hypothetical protein [Hymenobacter sp. BT18]QIX59849.1 hypothetical protein HER32_01045 [Hymenobacter sp. BT18]